MSKAGQGTKFFKGFMELVRLYPKAAAAFFLTVGGTAGGIVKGFYSELKTLKYTQAELIDMFRAFRQDFQESRREDLKYNEELRRESMKNNEEIRREMAQKFSELTVALYTAEYGHRPEKDNPAHALRKLTEEDVAQIVVAVKEAFKQLQINVEADAAGAAEEQI